VPGQGETGFIKQGDAICKEANEKNQSEAEDFAKEKTLKKANQLAEAYGFKVCGEA
jgi:hypothetical protein